MKNLIIAVSLILATSAYAGDPVDNEELGPHATPVGYPVVYAMQLDADTGILHLWGDNFLQPVDEINLWLSDTKLNCPTIWDDYASCDVPNAVLLEAGMFYRVTAQYVELDQQYLIKWSISPRFRRVKD